MQWTTAKPKEAAGDCPRLWNWTAFVTKQKEVLHTVIYRLSFPTATGHLPSAAPLAPTACTSALAMSSTPVSPIPATSVASEGINFNKYSI